MTQETVNLTNIHFMSKAQYDALETKNNHEIHNVACAAIIESFDDGNNWYRKWSDGWVEQGIYGLSVTAAQMTVTLPVAFASDSYTVVTEVIGTGATSYGEGVSVSARTSTGIVCHGYHSSATTAVMMSLYVCGQGA